MDLNHLDSNHLTDSPSDGYLLQPGELDRLGDLSLAARLIVDGFYSGRRRSPFHDRSAEFADYRPYALGDDVRSLDWKAYARTDRDFVRLTAKETELPCYIMLDSSASMAFRGAAKPTYSTNSTNSPNPTKGRRGPFSKRSGPSETEAPRAASPTKLRYAAYLAVSLSYLLLKQSDRVALAIGGEKLETYLPPSGTLGHLHKIVTSLERLQPTGPTKLTECLTELFQSTKRRGLLIVISDLIEEPEALFKTLGMYTHQGWQVVVLQVLSPDELDLGDSSDAAEFHNPEGDGVVNADPSVVRSAYRAEVERWLSELKGRCALGRIRYVLASTDLHFTVALERLFNAT